MRGYLLYNPNNDKFFSIKEILKYYYTRTIIHAILTKQLTDEDINLIAEFIKDKLFSENGRNPKALFNCFDLRAVFMREEIYNAFDIYTLIEFALNLKKFDVISVKVLNHLITRKFEDQDKAFLFILLPINKEVYNYIIFRREIINDSCLILYSIRSNTQIVEKGTPLEDPYVEELFQLDVKFNYEILFDYKVTKRALTKSLMASIHAKNIDAVNFLISKGVPVNIIIDSQTPLQYSISQSFIPGIEALLNHGASLEFNGTQTAAVCAEISQNADIIKLICSKINIKYECLFSDIRKIHVSKINQSSIPPLKEDIIKSVNIINSNKQSSFGLSLNFINNNNNSFPDEIIFGMFRNLVIGKRDNTNLFNTIKSEMLIGKTFNNPLRIITMFAPVDLTSIQHLFAHQMKEEMEFQSKLVKKYGTLS
ncbi:hypothetical protein TVAG_384070 [Trichomonas vaginalis G3]|uniref:DUF3447 domain-containing protein n=1 Tax=Trichomonas vaginalis (strain ATCC PRA-98 / G3) TaxID=412133 RepID=A2F0A6_TRIV3|nr:ankycorbin family [Trichomonas vaginalis G3]EAY01668.1 hypothetical protein TVAG_384070 [Trichomonas vaginalis G3]KAI5515702.1 ankycorbin family [Trichomonas vaginalis G3]|eukprot:XP_001314261.1 hypothetical protein [Trichomonas vaginalis G3]